MDSHGRRESPGFVQGYANYTEDSGGAVGTQIRTCIGVRVHIIEDVGFICQHPPQAFFSERPDWPPPHDAGHAPAMITVDCEHRLVLDRGISAAVGADVLGKHPRTATHDFVRFCQMPDLKPERCEEIVVTLPSRRGWFVFRAGAH
jgi:hypothetical protein